MTSLRKRSTCLLLPAVLAVTACSREADAPPAAPPEATPTAPPDSSTSDEPAAPLPARLDEIGRALHPLVACPDRVWEGARFDAWQLLFTSASERTAFAWNAAGSGKLEALDHAALSPAATPDYFDLVDHGGAKAVAISLDTTNELNALMKQARYVDFAVTVGVHEAFHLLTQTAWAESAQGGGEETFSSREPDYPDNGELRYLRWRLVSALRAAVDKGAPLGEAAYWHASAASSVASELAKVRSTDVAEGSAQYATTIAVVLGKLGCDATDAQVLAEVRRNMNRFASPNSDRFVAGPEPYDLGLLAGLLLRSRGTPGFAARAAAGVPLVDVLLDGVAVVPQPDDAAARAEAKQSIEKRNAEAAAWIEPMLERVADPAASRLVVGSNWYVGGYVRHDAFHLAEQPGRPVAVHRVTAKLKDPASGVDASVKDLDVLEGIATPCGSKTLVLPVAPGALAVAGGKASSASSAGPLEVNGLPVVVRTDAAGRSWLCATAP